MMSADSPSPATSAGELISALADGELGPAQFDAGCRAWAEGSARARWHAYHLIGDVLRCEDLSRAPARDAAFLQRLRARLEHEAHEAADPPSAMGAAVGSVAAGTAALPLPRRRAFASWGIPAALAAGVAALGTSLVMQPRDMQPAATLAGAPVAASAALAQAGDSAASPPANPQLLDAGNVVVRNARLDRYLRAHRDYGAVQPASLPGGARRGVETVSFER